MSQYAKNRQASRRQDFQKGLEAGDARRKREETALKLRKEKRTENFQKRRNVEMHDSSIDQASVCHFTNSP